MKKWRTRSDDALNLYQNIRIDWSNYDFTEQSQNVDHRVPTVIFQNDVEVRGNRVAPFSGAIVDSYFREYFVGYNDREYVLSIVTMISAGNRRFYCSIAVPAHGDLPQDCLLYCKL